MSKIVKAVKKVFKKIVKVVKKIIIPIVIVAAIVWTAGAALGAFASTASLGASLQAAGGAVFTGLRTIGSAIFTNPFTAAGEVGAGVTANLGAYAKGIYSAIASAVAEVYTKTKAIFAGGSTATAPTGATGTSGTAGTIGGGEATLTGVQGGEAVTATATAPEVVIDSSQNLLQKASKAWGEASAFEKVLMAKLGTDLVGGYLNPPASPEEIAKAEKKRRGAFYGRDAQTGKGPGGFVPYAEVTVLDPTPRVDNPAADLIGQNAPAVNPMQQGILPPDPTEGLLPSRPKAPKPQGIVMDDLIPVLKAA